MAIKQKLLTKADNVFQCKRILYLVFLYTYKTGVISILSDKTGYFLPTQNLTNLHSYILLAIFDTKYGTPSTVLALRT